MNGFQSFMGILAIKDNVLGVRTWKSSGTVVDSRDAILVFFMGLVRFALSNMILVRFMGSSLVTRQFATGNVGNRPWKQTNHLEIGHCYQRV